MEHVTVTPNPPPKSVSFAQAHRDSLNPGKINATGKCLPPNFAMHVDDKIYVAPSIPKILLATQASITANDLSWGNRIPQ